LLGSLEGRNYLEDLGVDVRIILKWFLGKHDAGLWTGIF
jgi:hypothetical protein